MLFEEDDVASGRVCGGVKKGKQGYRPKKKQERSMYRH
jgi:hypothetical protein